MKPLTLLFLAILGLLWIDIAVAYNSAPGMVYGGVVLGVSIGALCRSKEN